MSQQPINIMSSVKLDALAVIRKFRITAVDGKSYPFRLRERRWNRLDWEGI
jgi:hypothetical protein